MFDVGFFSEQILVKDINALAKARYEENRTRAFAHWVISQISPNLTPDEVENARSICEAHGSGDKGIDGAWLDSKRETLYLLQTKWVEGLGKTGEDADTDEDDEGDATPGKFALKNFGRAPASELMAGFKKIYERWQTQSSTKVSQKMLQVTALYNQAQRLGYQVRLIVCVAGKYGSQLAEEIQQINREFGEKDEWHGHFIEVMDLEALNVRYSANLQPLPSAVGLKAVSALEVPAPHSTAGKLYAYSLTVKATELIAIREKHGLNIFHANFRFVLKNSRIRQGMFATLADPGERTNFWRYNNGITVVCKSVEKTGNDFTITGFQVVNGLQTIETLFAFSGAQKDPSWVDDILLQVRIIPASTAQGATGPSLEEKIAEYSNSQNPITARDLRSNDRVQVELEAGCRRFGLRYQRKVGQYRKASDVVDNQKAAQACLAFWARKPHAAKHKKKLIFVFKHDKGYYEDIFEVTKTRASWLLLPYFLHENYHQWAESTSSVAKIRDHANFMALALVGNQLQSLYNTGKPDSVNTLLEEKFDLMVHKVMGFNAKKKGLKDLWSPAMDAVRLYVAAQKKKASDAGDEEPSDRNIIVGADLADVQPFLGTEQAEKILAGLRKSLA